MSKSTVLSPRFKSAEFHHETIRLDATTPARAFLHGQAEIPFHWHSAVEIVAVLRGSVQFEVSGSRCMMGEGDMMIINSDDLHSSVAWTDDAVVYGMHLDAGYFEAAGLPGFTRRRFLCRSFLHGKSFEAVSNPIKALVARAILVQLDRDDRAMVRRNLADLLALFIYHRVPWEESEGRSNNARGAGRSRILGIMQRVRDSGGAGASLAEVARQEGLSVSHLSRMFHAFVGVGFRDYAQNIRLDNAASDLRNTQKRVSDILNKNGFNNPTHFYNKFSERFGCSPAHYRKSSIRPSNPAVAHEPEEREIRDALRDELRHLDDAFDVLRIPSQIHEESLAIDAPHNMFAEPDRSINDTRERQKRQMSHN